MIPILYEKDEHRFSAHGLGSVPAWKKLTVTEERAGGDFGEFTLEGIVPIGSPNADQLAEERIICAAPAPYRSYYNPMQPFRIRRIVKQDNELHVLAHHISYELRENIVAPVGFAGSARWSSAQTAFDAILNGSGGATGYVFPDINGRFHFESDITPAIPVQLDLNEPASVRAWLRNAQNGFGGEFDFDGFTVRLKLARGQRHGVEITYGANLGGVEYTTDTEGLVTGYYCYWRGDQGYAAAIAYKANAGDYAYKRIVPVDLSNDLEPAGVVPTEQEMQAAANAYAATKSDNYIPNSITVTAIPEALQGVWLCDTVTVLHPVYQLAAEAKVVKTVYDPIRERYTAVTIGEIQKSVTDTIADMLRGRTSNVKRTRI